MRRIRVGGFFSGIGAHVSACDRLKDRAQFVQVFQCEFDEKTALAHDTIHGPIKNLGDITTVHDIGGDLQVDILYWTPPRQDISNAADCGVAQSRRRCFVISKLLGTPPDLPK